MPERSQPIVGSREALLWLVLSVALSVVSVWTMLDHGWVPLDEGTISWAAERVLHGAVPHVDFAYPYTGALPYVHAFAMRLFGVSAMASRYALFAAFTVWLPVLWWIAARRAGPRWAAVLTVLAAWWSLTVYPAAMPSWYLLFLATGCIASLDRWRDAPSQWRWLVFAGLLCGAAILVKQTGLYLLAGAALGVLLCDQDDERAIEPAPGRSPATDALVLATLGVLALLVVRLLLRRIDGSGEMLNLLAPTIGVVALAGWRERRLTRATAVRRRRLVARETILFAAAAVPVALFIMWYWRIGALDALASGAITDGWHRIGSLQAAMPSALTVLGYAWPMFVLVLLELKFADRVWSPALFALAALGLVALAFMSATGYLRLWYFAVALLPFVIAVTAWRASAAWRAGVPFDPIILVVGAMTAFTALNQYPFSAANYYAYVAPLAFLAALLIAQASGVTGRIFFSAFALLLFGGSLNRIGSVHTVGFGPIWWDDAHLLAMPRGQLRVTTADSANYTRMLALVSEHRGTGAILAGPELPEVYFLADAPVAAHDAYELVPEFVSDSTAAAELFARRHITVVVIKPEPMFAHALAPDMMAWIVGHYPHREVLGAFEVRWR